jgi:hypothetical protein
VGANGQGSLRQDWRESPLWIIHSPGYKGPPSTLARGGEQATTSQQNQKKNNQRFAIHFLPHPKKTTSQDNATTKSPAKATIIIERTCFF